MLSISDTSPPINFDKTIDYLNQVNVKCAACNHDELEIIATPNQQLHTYYVQSTDSNAKFGSGLKVIATACKRCGHVHFHASNIIRQHTEAQHDSPQA